MYVFLTPWSHVKVTQPHLSHSTYTGQYGSNLSYPILLILDNMVPTSLIQFYKYWIIWFKPVSRPNHWPWIYQFIRITLIVSPHVIIQLRSIGTFNSLTNPSTTLSSLRLRINQRSGTEQTVQSERLTILSIYLIYTKSNMYNKSD